MDIDKTSIELLFDISAGQRGRKTERQEHPLGSKCYCEQRNKMRQGGGERQRKEGNEEREEREWQIQICTGPQPL